MRSGSTSTRRASSILLTAALLFGAAGLRAQQQGGAPAGGGQAPAGGGQAAAAPAAADQFVFNSDGGLIIFQVKPDKTADFETFWTEVKTKLSGSDKPDAKQMGESLTIWKHAGTANSPTDPAVYIVQMNPAVKGSTYDPSKFMFAPGSIWDAKDARPLYQKLLDSIAGINILPVNKVAK